jgi:hypothetical protein
MSKRHAEAAFGVGTLSAFYVRTKIVCNRPTIPAVRTTRSHKSSICLLFKGRAKTDLQAFQRPADKTQTCQTAEKLAILPHKAYISGIEDPRWRLAGRSETLMNIGLQQTARPARMTGAQFRAFQDGRPDHERWELIAGIPMMMTPPKLAHNVIAGNLERLLNAALAVHDTKRLATQRAGIELAGIDDYKPEPDVGVIDAD